SSGCGAATAEDGGGGVAAGAGGRAAAAERADVAAGGSRFADADPDGDAAGGVGGSVGIACMTAALARPGPPRAAAFSAAARASAALNRTPAARGAPSMIPAPSPRKHSTLADCIAIPTETAGRDISVAFAGGAQNVPFSPGSALVRRKLGQTLPPCP